MKGWTWKVITFNTERTRNGEEKKTFTIHGSGIAFFILLYLVAKYLYSLI